MAKRAEGARSAGSRAWLLRSVTIVSSVVLVIAALGLIPSREPEVPAPEPLPARVVAESAAEAVAKEPEASEPAAVELDAFPLCDAPAGAARLLELPLLGQASTFAVSCRAGYELFALDVTAEPVTLTRLARFAWRDKLPGGAISSDLDGDGSTDFVFGVATAETVVHAPGAGAFLVRGRPQGGYQDPLALLEAPVQSLALMREAPGAGANIYVLGGGDPAAQRPAELSIFASGPPPRFAHRIRWGLLARDLQRVQIDAEGPPELLAIAQPGRRIERLVTGAAPAVEPVGALTDVQELISAAGSVGVFARTSRDVHKLVRREGKLETQPWLTDVGVGQALVADLDRDGVPDLLGVTQAGASFTPGAKPEAPHDLELANFHGEDALALTLSGGPRALLLFASGGEPRRLHLLLMPNQPWPKTTATQLHERIVRDAPAMAEIALE